MKGYVHSIEKVAEQNRTFRTVLYTAKNCQLVANSQFPAVLLHSNDTPEPRHDPRGASRDLLSRKLSEQEQQKKRPTETPKSLEFVRRKSMKGRRTLIIAAALIVCGACSAQAAHKDVKHCADDYRKFCHQWGLETKGLENCMRKHGDHLTNACVAALVKSGNVSQAEVDRRKKALAAKAK